MDDNATVSVRGLSVAALVTVLVATALLAAYLLGGAGAGGSPAQAADDGGAEPVAQRRVLTMTGTGEAAAVPDQLSFAMAVTLTRPDLDTALDAANRVSSRVLAALAQHDVERSDVQTTGLSMTPVYDYHQYAAPTIRGYRVSQRASVLVDELARGGAAVSAAVAAGGNDVRVSGIRLLVGDPDAVMSRAREAAVAEARTKAEQYAHASGQDLGEVVTLREVHARPLPTPTMSLGRLAAAKDVAISAVPIRAGRDETAVTVQVVWELT